MAVGTHVLTVKSNWSTYLPHWFTYLSHWLTLYLSNWLTYLSDRLNFMNVVVVFHNFSLLNCLNSLHRGLGLILELIFKVFDNLLVIIQGFLVAITQAINLISKLSFLHLVDLCVVNLRFFLTTLVHLDLNIVVALDLNRLWSLLEHHNFILQSSNNFSVLALKSVDNYFVLVFDVLNLVLVHFQVLLVHKLQLFAEKIDLLSVAGSFFSE